MIDNKPFAMFFNASPRKGWNTHKMLEAAKAGAEEAGATTELVKLYDIKFPGCKSCFACKLKNAKTNGVCAIRDDLRPILERARQADVLVLGSPIYFSYPTGVYRAFLERLAFPVYSYHGVQLPLRGRQTVRLPRQGDRDGQHLHDELSEGLDGEVQLPRPSRIKHADA